MGRVISGISGAASDAAAISVGGETLQGIAGANAINAGDLLLLNSVGKLYSARTSDFAAAANVDTTLVAPTTLCSYSLNRYSHKEIFANPVDGGLYVSYPSTTSWCGIAVAKYGTNGVLVKAIVIDSTSASSLQGSTIQQLSNNNILVTWAFQGGASYGTWFAIYDQLLNQVVAPVLVTASNTQFHDSIPLSGGGFAIAYQLAAGVTQAIYSNTGAVVSAAATVTGSPTSASAPRLAQLSNGNIAIAICSTVASKALGHAVVTAAGGAVLNYTVLNSATIAATTWPEISATSNGYYACAIADGVDTKGYVLSDAGVLQGAPFSVGNTNAENGTTTKIISLMTDGLVFWLAYAGSSGSAIVYLPVTGTGYVSNSAVSMSNGDAFIDRGNIVICPGGGGARPYIIGSAGTVTATANVTGLSLTPFCISKPAGDFTVISCSGSQAGGIQFGVFKYQNASIVGISRSNVVANSDGMVVPFLEGPGSYPCNQLGGTIGKVFDHTSSNIPANKGIMFGVSSILRGI